MHTKYPYLINLKTVDITLFCTSIVGSDLSDVYAISSPSLILSIYHSTISDILQDHGPIKARPVPSTHTSPWYTPELRVLKATRRRLEHLYEENQTYTVH